MPTSEILLAPEWVDLKSQAADVGIFFKISPLGLLVGNTGHYVSSTTPEAFF